jgi:hypothetical protein
MTRKRLAVTYAVTTLVVSVPFTVIHLLAKPGHASISPLQHAVAALANFLGPWGVAAVRLVDFPNAGMRSFSWLLAIVLTVIGGFLIAEAVQRKPAIKRFVLAVFWAGFAVVWFGVGLTQIADGLL